MDFNIAFKKSLKEANKYRYLNHYTDIETLKIILKNQSLLLNRIDKVDDLTEHKRIDTFLSKKGYVSCFTCRKPESYFFWKVYSHKENDSIGVRITFPNNILDNGTFYFDSECTKPLNTIISSNLKHKSYNSTDDWGLLRSYLFKIIYTENLNNFSYTDEWLKKTFGNCVNIKNDSFERNALPCAVKSVEWDNEEEIRLLVLVRPKGFETILSKKAFEDNIIPQPTFDNIFVNLPSEVLENCSFTISPFNNFQYDEATKIIKSYKATKNCIINKSVISI